MKSTWFFVLIALAALPCRSEVRLPKILSSHAVLQRNQPIHIWGWSDPGESVAVSLNGSSQSATGDRFGHWSVYLPPQPAGGPYRLTVNNLALDDILIGDVWFASGQSNMEMPLTGWPGAVLKNSAEEIRNATQPNIRLLLIPKKGSSYPLADFDGEVAWTACTPETAAKFSAAAYFFGREITKQENVPVGLVDSTWGGTPGEAWVSMDGLASDAGLMPVFASWAHMADQEADIPAMLKAEKTEDETAKQANQPAPHHSWHPDPSSYDPSWLFNGMVAPAIPYGIKGVIWYQGETNSSPDRAPMYHKVFSTLITDWRSHWNEGYFPFLFVQISSFKSTPFEHWPVVREAQLNTLSLVNTAMAVTIDIGDPDNVHPADKQTVGHRLALAARAIAYGEPVEYSGPIYREAAPEGNTVRVWFNHADRGLVAKGGPLTGFEIAGEDHRWQAATAQIDGNSVVVSGSGVERPKFVRYGWQNAPVVNLFNSAELPASPFTSDPEMR